MTYQAVIFDLFGTLVDNFSSREYDAVLMRMAAALVLPADSFKQMWFENKKAREIGALKGCEGRIECICAELREERRRQQIMRAAGIRLDYIRLAMRPRPGVIDVLLRLRDKEYRIGLISDCSHEIPVVWPDTPLAPLIDVAVFSCLTGFRKPDPRIYQLATEGLRVSPEQCLYIGDGGSEELTGALRAGMHPILFRLDPESTERHLVNRENWEGPRIESLEEVLTMVSEGRGCIRKTGDSIPDITA